MTSWTDKTIPSSPVTGAAVTAPVTSSCDIYCLPFGPTRLHSLDCQIANRMDPVFPDRKIDDVLPERSLVREWVSETPYREEAE